MRDQARAVVIEATFSCPAPSEAQVPFLLCGNDLRIRCTYRYGTARVIEARARIPKDEKYRNLETTGVGDLRKALLETGEISKDQKPDKAECQRLLSGWIDRTLKTDDFEESWRAVKETDFSAITPDFVLVPVSRDLESNLKMTETSLFGKLFRPILKRVLDDGAASDTLSALRGRLKEGVRDCVQDLQGLLRAQMNNERVALTHEVDLDPIKGIAFEFGMDDERATGIPIGNRGAGVHNNLILGMFRLLARYKASNFILAIEEPENSLHPRGQREMLWALQDVARSAQVLCTTHSSVFLDLGRLEDNIVLVRTGKGNTIARHFATDDAVSLRELLGIRVSDALLSGGGNCAMVVEGPTELGAYPHFFKLSGRDARALGVSVISAEGSDFDRIKRLLLVLNVYGIPAVVVLDGDAAKTAEDLRRFGPGGSLGCLRKVFLLREGKFESYIPLDVAVAVMNERFPEGAAISESDIDRSKDREREFQRVLYLKKPGVRFEHFKVEFGELVGRRMSDASCALHSEISGIIEFVSSVAQEV